MGKYHFPDATTLLHLLRPGNDPRTLRRFPMSCRVCWVSCIFFLTSISFVAVALYRNRLCRYEYPVRVGVGYAARPGTGKRARHNAQSRTHRLQVSGFTFTPLHRNLLLQNMSNAGNPITSWIKSGMEGYQARESDLVDRVAE